MAVNVALNSLIIVSFTVFLSNDKLLFAFCFHFKLTAEFAIVFYILWVKKTRFQVCDITSFSEIVDITNREERYFSKKKKKLKMHATPFFGPERI